MRHSPRLGFTLLELLVTVGLVAILVALLSVGTRSWLERSRSTACLSNLRSLGIALQLYLGENQHRMPPLVAARASRDELAPAIDTVLAPYLENSQALACPSDAHLARATGTSYYWNSAMSGQNSGNLNFLAFVEDASRIPLLCDKEGWHVDSPRKVNFLYADGHATRELTLFTTTP